MITQMYQIYDHETGNTASVQIDFNGKEVKVNTAVIPRPEPVKPRDTNYVCPFCNSQLDESLYNGIYGCDTGCEYVSIDIKCPKCHKLVWSSGTFGSFENLDEKSEYHAEFMEELAEEIEKIAPGELKEVERPVDNTPRSSEHSAKAGTSTKATPVNLNQESE